MRIIKEIFKNIAGYKYTKYIVTLFFIILIVGFLDDNSIMNRQERIEKIERLQSEISELKMKYEEDTRKLKSQEQHENVEKIARERYFMKRSNEDVFIIKSK
jgi:cell division protein FtsB